MTKHNRVSSENESAHQAKHQLDPSVSTQDAGSLLQRAQTSPGSLTANDVKHLQRTIGNRATVGLISSAPPIQAKLTLGPAGDAYEQEADQVADQVVRQIESESVQRQEEEEELQMKPLAGDIRSLQRTAVDPIRRAFMIQRNGLEEEEMLQGKYEHGPEGGEVDPGVTSQIQAARGGGRPLDDNVRGSMESGFGADFSGVRVHTDAQAADLNRSLNARAFTVGNDIFFGNSEYNPGNSNGQKLLAHELTHTVQQGAAQAKRSFEKPTIAGINQVLPEVQRWPHGSTKHLKDRAAERNISEDEIDDAIDYGDRYDDPDYPGGTVYYDDQTGVTVCETSDGTLTTCYVSNWPKSRWVLQ